MGATESMVGRDLYFSVNHSTGESHVQHARVWDAERFLAAQREAGMKPKDPKDRYTITPATEAEYKAQTRKGRAQ